MPEMCLECGLVEPDLPSGFCLACVKMLEKAADAASPRQSRYGGTSSKR